MLRPIMTPNVLRPSLSFGTIYRVSHAVASVRPTMISRRLRSPFAVPLILALIVTVHYQMTNAKPYRAEFALYRAFASPGTRWIPDGLEAFARAVLQPRRGETLLRTLLRDGRQTLCRRRPRESKFRLPTKYEGGRRMKRGCNGARRLDSWNCSCRAESAPRQIEKGTRSITRDSALIFQWQAAKSHGLSAKNTPRRHVRGRKIVRLRND